MCVSKIYYGEEPSEGISWNENPNDRALTTHLPFPIFRLLTAFNKSFNSFLLQKHINRSFNRINHFPAISSMPFPVSVTVKNWSFYLAASIPRYPCPALAIIISCNLSGTVLRSTPPTNTARISTLGRVHPFGVPLSHLSPRNAILSLHPPPSGSQDHFLRESRDSMFAASSMRAG